MPWKLIPPRPGQTIYFYVRGKYCEIRLNKSTGTDDEAAARRILATWRKQAERGEFASTNKAAPVTFVQAAFAYTQAGGEHVFLPPICKAWEGRLLTEIDQIAIDTLATELYPKASAATRNRQVYTPVSAVLKRAGVEKSIKRPVGWKGNKSTSWLEPDQAFALFEEADKTDPEFGLLCKFLLYTGMRLSEALSREMRDIRLGTRAFVYLPDSKNGEPRGCHLPPFLVGAFMAQPARKVSEVVRGDAGHFQTGRPLQDAGVPFLERSPEAKLFRFHDGGALRAMLRAAMKAAGLSFPRRQGGFHIFCHTYGSWMHRFGNLDTYGLVRTRRWKDPDSADRYNHTEATSEAKRSDLMPAPKCRDVVDITKKVG